MSMTTTPEPPEPGQAARRARQEALQHPHQPAYYEALAKVTGDKSLITGSQPPPAASVHDGLAIAAFITAWLAPFIGLILGWVSVSAAHQARRRASGLAVAAVVIGALFTLAGIIAAIVLVAHLGSPPCDLSNPAYPNC